ncbi:MAG: hypothetical protein AAF995_03000 [Planctomycetota bacterium]
MLHPAPTTPMPAETVRATLRELIQATATKPAFVVLEVFNSDYLLHLEPAGGAIPDAAEAKLGKTVTGKARATAKRIDKVGSGGKYLEPVRGRPRRVQGRVVAVNASANTITVNAGVPIVCKVSAPGQKAGDFEVTDFVSFDVLRGATFEMDA